MVCGTRRSRRSDGGVHPGRRAPRGQLGGHGRSITVRLVGEIFDTVEETSDHIVLRGAWSDLLVLDPGARPTRWEVQPASGMSSVAYTSSLRAAMDGQITASAVDDGTIDESFLL